jgi:NAD(P)-dependent dehydrogenase (short-subunit alcohol dehydrogenase family)
VITGATSGVGRATALALAARGVDLLLVGRTQRRGDDVVRLCQQRNPTGIVRFLRTDISCLADVWTLAAEIARISERVDVLINNAGARYDTYAESRDGIERTFAGNHLGHFLLTHLLLERLTAARPGQVISVGSRVHAGANLDRGWIEPRDGYDRRRAYANSKLASIVFARELAARHDSDRLTSNAVDPGIVVTRFARNNGLVSWIKHLVSHGLRRELVSPSTGADTIVYLATGAAVERGTGRYLHERRDTRPLAVAADAEVGRQLWKLSLMMSGLSEAAIAGSPTWALSSAGQR